MANAVGSNPWILDTAATLVAAGLKRVYPKKLVWTGEAIADGDALLVKDGDAVVVFDWHALADDTGIVFDFPEGYSMDGFVLTTIGHGTLYVYF